MILFFMGVEIVDCACAVGRTGFAKVADVADVVRDLLLLLVLEIIAPLLVVEVDAVVVLERVELLQEAVNSDEGGADE